MWGVEVEVWGCGGGGVGGGWGVRMWGVEVELCGCGVHMLHAWEWVCTEVRGGYVTITTRYSDAQAVAHLTEELELGGVGMWCGKVGCEVYMLHVQVWVCTEVGEGSTPYLLGTQMFKLLHTWLRSLSLEVWGCGVGKWGVRCTCYMYRCGCVLR